MPLDKETGKKYAYTKKGIMQYVIDKAKKKRKKKKKPTKKKKKKRPSRTKRR